MKSYICRSHQQRAAAAEYVLNCDYPIKVTVEKHVKARSLGLNAYLWGFVTTPLAEFMGESPEYVHRLLCGEYWGWVEKEFRGKRYRKPRRTTTTNEEGKREVLDQMKMRDFVYFCESISADMGVPVKGFEQAQREAA